MQDLQGHQEPVEQPPGRVGTNQLPAFKQGCVQNPSRDPEIHLRSAVPSSEWRCQTRCTTVCVSLSICCSAPASQETEQSSFELSNKTEHVNVL
ncbi:hypothetical protein Nmel_018845 [Mimus melanotis]